MTSPYLPALIHQTRGRIRECGLASTRNSRMSDAGPKWIEALENDNTSPCGLHIGPWIPTQAKLECGTQIANFMISLMVWVKDGTNRNGVNTIRPLVTLVIQENKDCDKTGELATHNRTLLHQTLSRARVSLWGTGGWRLVRRTKTT